MLCGQSARCVRKQEMLQNGNKLQFYVICGEVNWKKELKTTNFLFVKVQSAEKAKGNNFTRKSKKHEGKRNKKK